MACHSTLSLIKNIFDGSADDKLRDLFEFYDTDGDGKIERDELKNVLALCAHDLGLEVDNYLEQIVDAVFNNQNTNTGTISFDDLRQVLQSRPHLINELAITNNTCVEHTKTKNTQSPWTKLRWDYISNNLVRVGFLCTISSIMLILFITRLVSYWESCTWLMLARASGQCLNFLCSIIVLLVCRRSISHLRSRGFGEYLPLDDSVYFHKMIGWFIVGHALVHTLGHILNFSRISAESGQPLSDLLVSTHLGIGWIGGGACITGWLLLLVLMIMAIAQPYARRFGKFELFYYTHLLYVPFWVLLFIHAPHYWCWFLGPFTIFIIETFFRLRNFIRNLTPSGSTTILKGIPLPSGVVHLVIKRPTNFEYNPGDWIYILIPNIAKYEWHPFTISSAPEQDGVIWLHIRAVGEWTRSLRQHFEGVENRDHLKRFIRSGQFSMSVDGQLETSVPPLFHHNSALPPIEESKEQVVLQLQDVPHEKQRIIAPSALKIFIDGPYGSPSSQIFRTEHAILVATGIGVTPFASILQSIVHHYQKARQRCPKCKHGFFDNRPPTVFKLKKVDFVWINRDQKSFEWFIKLLAELELTQSDLPVNERFLDIHIHLTAMQPSQIKSIGIQLALYLMHEKNNKDLVTGLKTRTKAGRPNWNELFENIQKQKRGKVTVFFCGRPQLSRMLHRSCDKFGFNFRKEVF